MSFIKKFDPTLSNIKFEQKMTISESLLTYENKLIQENYKVLYK